MRQAIHISRKPSRYSTRARRPCYVLLLALVAASSLACADENPQIQFTFDDPAGTPPIKSEPTSHAEGVAVTCRRTGEWYPLVASDGVQTKNIVGDSETVLSEGDRPIALERGKDYEIDHKGGRFKALDGGRVELGQPCSLSYRFTNPGPKIVNGMLVLDGVDDFLILPSDSASNRLSFVLIEMSVLLADDCSPNAVLVAKGDALGIRLVEGAPAVFGSAIESTSAVKKALPKNQWIVLTLIFDGKHATLSIEGVEAAKSVCKAPELKTPAAFRIGGTRDPEFFAGRVDYVTLWGR
jgi:hypothetical protein